MRLPIYEISSSSPGDFVAFWSQQYSYDKEGLYTRNIGKELTRKRVEELFEWKNGSRLAAQKARSVEKNYIGRISEVNKLPLNTEAESFLRQFASGGAIWRIFWLHCWQPARFPIYDQHVHRAMSFIEAGEREEISRRDASKVDSYLLRYLPFHSKFSDVDSRTLDRALWVFGKFIKNTRFPLTATG